MDWDAIRKHLIIKDVKIYHVAGTLCVDIKDPPECVCLQLDGRASYFSGDVHDIQPKDINVMVQRIYFNEKGDTDYFIKETLKAAERYSGGK